MRHPHVLQLIMDSLRYWVTEMHVDGFRFDLAATLARQFHEVDRLSAFFDLVQQDPVVSPGQADRRAVGRRRRRLPGRQLPAAVDGVERQVPRHRARLLARRAAHARRVRRRRLTGSCDLYEHDGRRPIASINFVTAHDGFTLRDLVSYNEKHNEANGEGNNDGESHNRSWNCGVEGQTDDPEVSALRARQQRNFLTTLLLSPGRADDRARRRARPHPAGQQQRLLPGQRARLGRLGPRRRREATCSSSPRAWSAPAPGAPVFRRRRFFAGQRRPRRTSPSSATSPGSRPTGEPMGEAAWPTGEAADRHGLPQRRRHRRAGPARPAAIARRLLPRALQRPPRARTRSPCPDVGSGGRALGSPRSTPAPTSSTQQSARVAGSELQGRSRASVHRARAARARRRAQPSGSRRRPAEALTTSRAQPERPDPGRTPSRRRPYRLPGPRRVRLRRGGASTRAVPRLARASRTSTCRRSCRRRRARRTATTCVDHTRLSEELGGRDGVRAARRRRAARRGSASSSTSCPTTWPCRRRPGSTRPCGRCCATGRRSPYAGWFDVDWVAEERRAS